jgi:hypothetical protein
MVRPRPILVCRNDRELPGVHTVLTRGVQHRKARLRQVAERLVQRQNSLLLSLWETSRRAIHRARMVLTDRSRPADLFHSGRSMRATRYAPSTLRRTLHRRASDRRGAPRLRDRPPSPAQPGRDLTATDCSSMRAPKRESMGRRDMPRVLRVHCAVGGRASRHTRLRSAARLRSWRLPANDGLPQRSC